MFRDLSRFTARQISVLLTFLAVITACGGNISSEEYIDRANRFIADTKYDAAIIELKNALQQDSNSGEARWLLGKLYLELDDIPSAEKELVQAKKLGWVANEVIPALAETLLAQGKYIEVKDLPKTGLQPLIEAKLLALKAQAELALGANKKASRLINQALVKAPDLTEALVAKARLLASQGDLTGAGLELDKILAGQPEHGPTWRLMGDIKMSQQDLQGAKIAYDNAVDFNKSTLGDRLKRSLLLLQLQDYDAAQADASAILNLAPQHPMGNYIQGIIHFQDGNYSEAVTSLTLAEAVAEQFPIILFFLGNGHLIEGNQGQALNYARRFNTLAPQSIPGRKLLATISLQEGKYVDVQALLQPVLDAKPNDVGALNLMANALLLDGKTDEGITLLSRVAALQPGSPLAQVRLGAGLLISDKGEESVQHMETAIALNPEFQQADILLVLNHAHKKDYPAAIKAAEAYQLRNILSPTPYNLMGRVHLASGDHKKAKEAFDKALKLDPSDPAAHQNLAQMAIAGNDLPSARQHYETILESHEDFLPTLIQLAILDARENNEPAMVAHLQQAIEAHPMAIQPRLLLGRYHLSKGRPEQVAPLFNELEDVQKQSPQVLQILALAQLADDDPIKARYTLQQLINSTTETAPSLHLLAMAAKGAGDKQRTQQALRRALEIDENYVPSRIVLAKIALANEFIDEFNEHLIRLETIAPENTDVLLLRATSAQLKGDPTTAVEFAEKAFEQIPTTSTVLALAAHQKAANQRNDALQTYKHWLEENPNDVVVRIAIANGWQVTKKLDEALLHYEIILTIEPDNIVALNNAAWLTREQSPAQALEYARRAAVLTPDSANVLDTLAVVEYANKDYEKARRSVERALQLSPDNPNFKYHHAMIAAALGNKTLAVNILDPLLSSDEQFTELEEAKALSARLKN